MKVTPITNYHGARFPTRRIIDEHPELLKLVPKRWQTNPAVLTALAGLCVMMAGVSSIASEKSEAPGSRIAPVFVHGDGLGCYGCIAINPPVFLSEAEAREVVIEEAKRAGIHFVVGGPAIAGVTMPSQSRGRTAARAPLRPDGFESARNIAFVLVTRRLCCSTACVRSIWLPVMATGPSTRWRRLESCSWADGPPADLRPDRVRRGAWGEGCDPETRHARGDAGALVWADATSPRRRNVRAVPLVLRTASGHARAGWPERGRGRGTPLLSADAASR